MAAALKVCLFMLVASSFVEGIRFYLKPAEFFYGDSDIKKICSLRNETIGTIARVMRMKIEKKVGLDQWQIEASISYDEKITSQNPEAKVTGYVGTALESYLQLTYTDVSKVSAGTYRCIASVERTDQAFATRMSDELPMVGKERNVFNLYSYLKGYGEDLMTEVKAVKTRTYEMETSINTHFTDMEKIAAQLLDVSVLTQNQLAKDVLSRLERIENALMGNKTSTTKKP